MDKAPFVEILMATYNGKKFLQEQLDSISRQTYSNWKILARDDGSTDSTPKILKAYQDANPTRMHIIGDNEGNLGGYTQNFERLAKQSSANVIAFSDQDDVWKPKKIEQGVKILQDIEYKFGTQTPAIVHHDFTVVDQDSRVISNSYDASHRYCKSSGSYKIMPYAAEVHGFSMMVNRALIDVALPFPKIALGHDSVMACLANDLGVIEFIPEQLALYRRHGNNSSQGDSFAKRSLKMLFEQASLGNFRKNISDIFQEAHNNLKRKCDATQSYVDSYANILPPERVKELEIISNLSTLGTIERKMTIYKYSGTSTRSAILASLVL